MQVGRGGGESNGRTKGKDGSRAKVRRVIGERQRHEAAQAWSDCFGSGDSRFYRAGGSGRIVEHGPPLPQTVLELFQAYFSVAPCVHLPGGRHADGRQRCKTQRPTIVTPGSDERQRRVREPRLIDNRQQQDTDLKILLRGDRPSPTQLTVFGGKLGDICYSWGRAKPRLLGPFTHPKEIKLQVFDLCRLVRVGDELHDDPDGHSQKRFAPLKGGSKQADRQAGRKEGRPASRQAGCVVGLIDQIEGKGIDRCLI